MADFNRMLRNLPGGKMRRAGLIGGCLLMCFPVAAAMAEPPSVADVLGGNVGPAKVGAKPVAAAGAAQGEAKKAETPGDTRPAKKIFGAAKMPAALAARAIGGYAKGCLAGGRALAIDGPTWQAMRLSRNRNWGHPKLIALLERFSTEMREKEQWPGLLIGDLAQPRGGPMLTGHKSHQLGLDADIWFRPMPEKRMTKAERETAQPLLLAKDNGSEVIKENWNEGFVRLVRRAAKYPEVERIFVHPAIKKAFCNAAGTDRDWLRKVRPMWLHNYHFHVRMACPADSPTCVPQKAVNVEGDGCGKEIDDWIKLVSTPPKPSPKPAVPVKPAKPKPPLMLKDLPPECTQVADAGDAQVQPADAEAPMLIAPPQLAKPKAQAAQQ
jgi:penicillin-insensitive murein endopeptidase